MCLVPTAKAPGYACGRPLRFRQGPSKTLTLRSVPATVWEDLDAISLQVPYAIQVVELMVTLMATPSFCRGTGRQEAVRSVPRPHWGFGSQ